MMLNENDYRIIAEAMRHAIHIRTADEKKMGYWSDSAMLAAWKLVLGEIENA